MFVSNRTFGTLGQAVWRRGALLSSLLIVRLLLKGLWHHPSIHCSCDVSQRKAVQRDSSHSIEKEKKQEWPEEEAGRQASLWAET